MEGIKIWDFTEMYFCFRIKVDKAILANQISALETWVFLSNLPCFNLVSRTHALEISLGLFVHFYFLFLCWDCIGA